MSTKFDENGVRYIFGSYTKDDGWLFGQFSFEISNPKRGSISGQYLTSNWFSNVYEIGDVQQYMLIGIKGDKLYRDEHLTISKMFNSVWPPPLLSQSLTKEELEFGIEFKDVYILDDYKSKDIVKEKKITDCWTIRLQGKYGLSALNISVRMIKNNKLYMTLPDFIISC
jgi:hypothetical protein